MITGGQSPFRSSGGHPKEENLEKSELKKSQNKIQSSPIADILKDYHVEEYFPEIQHPLEKSLEEPSLKKIDPVAFGSLSSKLNVHPKHLIENGTKVLDERMGDNKVYSASIRLDLDNSLIKEGEVLLRRIETLKNKYHDLTEQMKNKCHLNMDPTKEDLEKYKKDYEEFSKEKRVIEGLYSDLKKKVEKRIRMDKLGSTEPLQEVVGSFAARHQMDPIQVLKDLNVICSNTLTISNFPAVVRAAIIDAETEMPDFCYYFCYLCYLSSEKIGHGYFTETYFSGWYKFYWYNFIDNALVFNENNELQKMDAPDQNNPQPLRPSYFNSESERDLLTGSL